MFYRNTLLAALFAASALNAHAEDKPEFSIDSTKEVAYQCKVGTEEGVPMTAMYGIKNGEIVVAQLKLADVISPGLFPVADNLVNRYAGEMNGVPTMWTTLPATADTITQTDGGIYSYQKPNQHAHTIIADKCKLDAAATAKLNRAK